MSNVIKFETKEIVYFVKDNKVTFAQNKATGRFIKHYIAQAMHDKMVNAAKSVKSFLNKNFFQANIWKEQLKTYFKSFGFNVSCVDIHGKHGLTLNTFMKLA